MKSTITQKNPTGYKQSLASFRRGKSKTGVCHKPLEPVPSYCNLLAACLVCLPKQPYLLVLSIQQPCPRKCWVLLTFSLPLQPTNYTTTTVAKHFPSKGTITSFYTPQSPSPKSKNFKHCSHTKSARTESCCWLLPCPCCPPTVPLVGDKQLPNKPDVP